MHKLTIGQRVCVVVLMGFLFAACGDLAGDVQIVSTVAPEMPQSQASANALPLELPENSPDIANGAQIYQQNCTSCHGPNGTGNGELVESGEVPRMGSFLDPIHMRQQSVEFYYDIITNGNLINLMPPWSGSLSVQERWDVAMYAYTLHYTEEQVARGAELVDAPDGTIQLESDNALASQSGFTGEDAYAAIAYERLQAVRNWGADAATNASEEMPALESVSFRGQVMQGSPNATLPDDLRVQLQYGDFLDVAEAIEGTLDANGQFSFSDVPVVPNSTYFTVVIYDGRAFVSDRLETTDLQAENTSDITIYETSDAPNIVNQTALDLVLDYLPVQDLGNGLVTRHLAIYDNPTDYVFHLEPEGQNVRVSLLISLPVGAIFLDAPEQSNFIQVQEQFALIDTRPVYPGRHTAETSYFIPYESERQTVDIRMNNRFEGDVSIVVVDPELSITGEGFELVEQVNLGTDEAPVMANRFETTLSKAPGESIIFDVTGRVSLTTSDDNNLLTQDQLIPILMGVVVAIILLFGALTWYLRRNNQTDRQINAIQSELVRLETLHDAGEINHDVYHDKRKALKAQLTALMREGQPE